MTAHPPSRRSTGAAWRQIAFAAVVQCLLAFPALSVAPSGAAAPAAVHATGNEASVPAKGWPPDSLFHVNPRLETAAGRGTSFAATGARVQIVNAVEVGRPHADTRQRSV